MLSLDLTKKSINVLIIRSCGVLLLFGFTLFITNFFSPEDVGRYDFVRSALNILGGIALMGTNQAIIYYSGFLKARANEMSIKYIYFNMIKIVFSVSAILLLLHFFLINENTFNKFFNNQEAYGLISKTVFSLIFFTTTMLNIDTIRALNHTVFSEVYRNIFRYVPIFLFSILLFLFETEELIAEAYLVGFFILSTISTAYVLIKLNKIKFGKKTILRFSSKDILLTSAPMALSAIAYFIMQSVDVIILSIYKGFEEIAFYSVSVKLATLTALALMSVNIVVAPKIAEIFENKDMTTLQQLVKNSTRIIFLVSICVLSILFFFSEEILNLFGEGYVVAKNALIFLLAAQFFNAVSGPGAIYLNMTGRQKILNKILILGLVVNISLNFYLIPSHGINGAAIATLVSLIIWNSITTLLIFYKDKIKIFLN